MKNIKQLFTSNDGLPVHSASWQARFFAHAISVILLVAPVMVPVASASEIASAPLEAEQPKVEAYGGVVVNQTITMIGEDFYKLFSTLWNEKANIEPFSLLIRERPSVRQGSQIWIEAGQKRIFQAQLPTTRSHMHELAEQAVEMTYDNLIGADIQMRLFPEPDLGKDEF